MRRWIAASTALVVAVFARGALAADEAAPPAAPVVTAKKLGDPVTPATFVPTLQIAGNSDKSVTIKGGADIRIPKGVENVWAISPLLSATTSGPNATLLTVGGDSSSGSAGSPLISTWSAGVSGEYSWSPMPEELDLSGPLAQAEAKARQDAAASCEDSFADKPAPPATPPPPPAPATTSPGGAAAAPAPAPASPPPTTLKGFCVGGGQLPASFDSGDIAFCKQLASGHTLNNVPAPSLCKDGSDKYHKAIAPLEKQASVIRRVSYQFPVYDVSLWLGGGQGLFKYLQSASGSAAAGTAVYGSQSESHPNLSAAAAFTYVQRGASSVGVTIEAQGAAQALYKASTANATTCSVKGTLPGANNTSSSVSSCTTGTLNGPTSTATTAVAAYAGVVDKGHAIWRAAIGPTLSNDLNAGTLTFGVSLPVYVNVVSVVQGLGTGSGQQGAGGSGGSSSGGSSGDYSGLIRVTPTLQYSTLPGGGSDTEFLITVAILAQRNMFSNASALVK